MVNESKFKDWKKTQKIRKLTRTTTTPNANSKKKSIDVLDALHASRVYTVNYQGKFEKQANWLIVKRVQALKHAACQQKWIKKGSQQQKTSSAGHRSTLAKWKKVQKDVILRRPNESDAVDSHQQ